MLSHLRPQAKPPLLTATCRRGLSVHTIKPRITAIKAIRTITKRQLVKMKTGKLPLLIVVFFLVSLVNQADCFYLQNGVRHYIRVSVISF